MDLNHLDFQPPNDELPRLVAAMCDGAITGDEFAQLKELLRREERARQFYVAYLDLHGRLLWRFRSDEPDDDVVRASQSASSNGQKEHGAGDDWACDFDVSSAKRPRPASPTLGFLGSLMHAGGTPVASALMWMVMALCSLGVVLTIAFVVLIVRGVSVHVDQPNVAKLPDRPAGSRRDSGSETHTLSTVARLTQVKDCEWVNKSSGAKLGEDLGPGRKLALKSGLAEITFQSGVRTVLEGPATLDIRSRQCAYLQLGKLAVLVLDPLANGFAVRTPGMTYTDLGTEFGVMVADDGSQQVHVFRGKVQAEESLDDRSAESHNSPLSTGSNSAPMSHPSPLVLTAHQAIRIEPPATSALPGRHVEQIAADDKQFVRAIPRGPHRAEIVNAAFDEPRLHSNEPWRGRIPGWEGRNEAECGVNQFNGEFIDPPPGRTQLAFLNEGEIYQELSERLAPHTRYRLTFWVGNRDCVELGKRLRPDYAVALRAGTNVLVERSNPIAPESKHFAKATVEFTTGDLHEALGETLEIVFRSNGSRATGVQNILGEVRLDVEPVESKEGR